MLTKRRIWEILEVATPGDKASGYFDLLIQSLIVLNVIAVLAETVEPWGTQYAKLFVNFEIVSVVIFTVEYLLRIISCTSDPRFRPRVLGRLHFASTPLALIDLLAILPFYLPFLGFDLRVLRALRLFRLARIGKLGRYSESLRTLGRVVVAKKEELIVTLSILSLLLILASSVMYFVEHEAQPTVFSSIPAAMWWAVATLTTVGYGDTYPVTIAGKAIASVISILGIGMFALPTGILGAAFVEEVEKKKKGRARRCPHCGGRIE
jgi:voltage-gated potassium channel